MSILFVVPTPIGNLEDITLRAIRVLKECDIVAAEDTRTTSFLLNHLSIEKKIISHHKFNEHTGAAKIIDLLRQGLKVALVSDAGTPGISDPGFLLVRECVDAGMQVEVLPGATALIPALVASGLPSDRFCFEGFLPHKKGRTTRLKELSVEPRTIILYESPYRVVKTLGQLAEYFGCDRQISLSREISKKFEETFRGTVQQALEHFSKKEPKGEFVLTVAGTDYSQRLTRNKNVGENEIIDNGEDDI